MTAHRYDYNYYKKQSYEKKYIKSFDLFDEYGVENCNIILLELYPCSSRDELTSRESYFIRSLDCVNKIIPDRTHNEYCETNKDIILKSNKQYREENKEAISEKKKKVFDCECGSNCRYDDKARHNKSKKHLDFIASKSQ